MGQIYTGKHPNSIFWEFCDAIVLMQMSKTGRLPGLDAARTLAILGMFAAHIFPLYQLSNGSMLQPTATGMLASGRASVLFMVLAGASLSLFSAGLVRRGRTHRQVGGIILRRAGVIALLGLLIGPINEGIANILVHYGLLFAVLSLVLFLPSRLLAALALGWLVLTPVLWRPLAAAWSGQSLGHNPTFLDFIDPPLLLQDLSVTGYYPLLVWLGFGLLGLWVGRLRLDTARTASCLLAAGAFIAAGSWIAGWLAFKSFAADLAASTGMDTGHVDTAVVTGRAPSGKLDSFLGDERYLWVPAAHSTSLLATIHAAGCALAILGLFLLVTHRLGYLGRLIAAAGRAPLTLYAGHLLMLPILQVFFEPAIIWWILCAVVVLTAIILERSGRSAPLEAMVRYLSGAQQAAGPSAQPRLEDKT